MLQQAFEALALALHHTILVRGLAFGLTASRILHRFGGDFGLAKNSWWCNAGVLILGSIDFMAARELPVAFLGDWFR